MSVVIGAIIGVGIFFTPSSVARLTHSTPLALTAWTIGGIIALSGAFVFAALGRKYHDQAAQYVILKDAYGPAPAFMFVFCNATAIQPGAIAIIALICVDHIAAALRPADAPELSTLSTTAMAAVLIFGLMAANALGVRWGARIQNLTVAAKIITLCAVGAIAIFAAPESVTSGAIPEPETPASDAGSAIKGVLAALVPAFFAFGGWQHALWVSGEVRNPKRTLPIAIFGGVLIVVAVYLIANWAYLRMLGPDGVAQSSSLAADAVAVAIPGAGPRIIAAAVAVSAFGVLNAQFLSGPRLLFGMALDGRFFKPFAHLSPRHHTPKPAIALLGVAGLLLLILAAVISRDRVDALLTGVILLDSVFFGLTGLAWFVLRRKGVQGILLPGAAIAAGIFVICELALFAGSFLNSSLWALFGLIWIAVASAVYAVNFRSNNEART